MTGVLDSLVISTEMDFVLWQRQVAATRCRWVWDEYVNALYWYRIQVNYACVTSRWNKVEDFSALLVTCTEKPGMRDILSLRCCSNRLIIEYRADVIRKRLFPSCRLMDTSRFSSEFKDVYKSNWHWWYKKVVFSMKMYVNLAISVMETTVNILFMLFDTSGSGAWKCYQV